MIFNYIPQASDKIHSYFKNIFDIDSINIDEINACRTHAFEIQAFGRVIRRVFKKSELKESLNQSVYDLGSRIKLNGKFIEDSIGEYLYHFEMKSAAHDESNLLTAKKELAVNINKFETIALEIKKDFSKLCKICEDDLKRLYLIGLRRELKKIKEDIELIDPSLLEDGTHELRRKLRWAIMYIIYPKGLFGYIEQNPKTSKYTKLDPKTTFKPVLISFEIMDFLSSSVYGLGQLKDEGLLKNYNKPHDNINESTKEISEYTQKIIKDFLKNKYFKKLRSDIKEHL